MSPVNSGINKAEDDVKATSRGSDHPLSGSLVLLPVDTGRSRMDRVAWHCVMGRKDNMQGYSCCEIM
jgi:hypothetical protein